MCESDVVSVLSGCCFSSVQWGDPCDELWCDPSGVGNLIAVFSIQSKKCQDFMPGILWFVWCEIMYKKLVIKQKALHNSSFYYFKLKFETFHFIQIISNIKFEKNCWSLRVKNSPKLHFFNICDGLRESRKQTPGLSDTPSSEIQILRLKNLAGKILSPISCSKSRWSVMIKILLNLPKQQPLV